MVIQIILEKSINAYEDSLSSKLLNIDDYGRLSGYQGDMGFTEITKQSFMSFSDWAMVKNLI